MLPSVSLTVCSIRRRHGFACAESDGCELQVFQRQRLIKDANASFYCLCYGNENTLLTKVELCVFVSLSTAICSFGRVILTAN